MFSNSESTGQPRNIKQLGFLMALLVVLTGIWLMSKYVTNGQAGHVAMKAFGVEFSSSLEQEDLHGMLKERSNDVETRALVKSVFGLYELDNNLLAAIKKQKYTTEFSRQLRQMRDHMIGPFNPPEVSIQLIFSDDMTDARAKVCSDSIFLNQSVNISTPDRKHMYSIENANELLIYDCPAANRKPETMVVASEFGSRLLKTDKPPPSINAIAKPLSVRFVTNKY